MKQAMDKTVLIQAVETYLNEHFFRPEKAIKVDDVTLPYNNTSIFEFDFRFKSEVIETPIDTENSSFTETPISELQR